MRGTAVRTRRSGHHRPLRLSHVTGAEPIGEVPTTPDDKSARGGPPAGCPSESGATERSEEAKPLCCRSGHFPVRVGSAGAVTRVGAEDGVVEGVAWPQRGRLSRCCGICLVCAYGRSSCASGRGATSRIAPACGDFIEWWWGVFSLVFLVGGGVGGGDGFAAGVDVEFAHEAFDVAVDGGFGEDEVVGDVFGVGAFADVFDDFPFAGGEAAV